MKLWTKRVLTVAAVMLVLSAFTTLANPQGGRSTFQLSQPAAADALSDGVNNSMESYVPILLTIIFVVLIIGAIMMLKRRS